MVTLEIGKGTTSTVYAGEGETAYKVFKSRNTYNREKCFLQTYVLVNSCRPLLFNDVKNTIVFQRYPYVLEDLIVRGGLCEKKRSYTKYVTFS